MNEKINKTYTIETKETTEEIPAGDTDSSTGTVITLTPGEERKAPTDGTYVHKFGRPFEAGGKTYKTLRFDFERLTGRDMINIENEMQAMQEYVLAPEISRSFQSKMAAKAGGIGSDVLENMPLNEFNRITNAARDFLISTGY